MKIFELQTENVKRLHAVEVKPDGALVVIGGKNGAGKSSVLDSIVYGLGGAAKLPAKPVREGKKEALVEIKLDSNPPLVITRKIRSDGKTSLEIKQVVGSVASKLTSPQGVLDALVGTLAFDPLAFTRLPRQGQVDMLQELLGLDLSEFDDRIKDLFAERTDYGRRQKSLKAQMDERTIHEDAPDELVVIVDLVAELDRINAHNEQARESEEYLAGQTRLLRGAQGDLEACDKEIERQKERLAETVARSGYFRNEVDAARAAYEKAEQVVFDREDDSEIRQRIAGAEASNLKYHDNEDFDELAKAEETHRLRVEELTGMIDKNRRERADRLAAAKWPVEGLSFADSGVTFEGLPFDQCSSAEQLRISAAIGLSQNRDLRILLIRDGSLLDDESLAALGTLAEEQDAQVWIERVGQGEECSVVIEDGSLLEPADAVGETT